MEKYNSYTTEDFLDDDDFIAFCKYRGENQVRQWEDWLNKNPDSAGSFREARAYLEVVYSAVRLSPPEQLESRLLTAIQEDIVVLESRLKKRRVIRMMSMAAAACICAVAASLWYLNSDVTFTTKPGEHKQITLPDNSVVTLNANSSLTYHRAWWWHKTREVWLKGEGFFKVRHLNKDTANVLPGERFTAYAGNLKVQVLGTTFNIKERRSRITVALLEGKISVSRPAEKGQTPVILEKGGVYEYGQGKAGTTEISQLTNQPQAWTQGKIVASGMTVQDIINNYEDTYGYRIVLDNPALAEKTIDGTISIGADDNLLFMLANILNADVERNGKVIYLRSK